MVMSSKEDETFRGHQADDVCLAGAKVARWLAGSPQASVMFLNPTNITESICKI